MNPTVSQLVDTLAAATFVLSDEGVKELQDAIGEVSRCTAADQFAEAKRRMAKAFRMHVVSTPWAVPEPSTSAVASQGGAGREG